MNCDHGIKIALCVIFLKMLHNTWYVNLVQRGVPQNSKQMCGRYPVTIFWVGSDKS